MQSSFRRKIDSNKTNYPPIFILGLPRTGSTLLYQLCARRFQTCYLSNFMMKDPQKWFELASLSYYFFGCHPPNCYSSDYGESNRWRKHISDWI